MSAAQSSPEPDHFDHRHYLDSQPFDSTPSTPTTPARRHGHHMPSTPESLAEDTTSKKAVTPASPASPPSVSITLPFSTVSGAARSPDPPIASDPARMRFDNMNASSASSHRQRYLAHPHPPSLPNPDPETVNNKRDGTRYMTQLRHVISERVRDDWSFQPDPAATSTPHSPPPHHGSYNDTTAAIAAAIAAAAGSGSPQHRALLADSTTSPSSPPPPPPPAPNAPEYRARTYSPPSSRPPSPSPPSDPAAPYKYFSPSSISSHPPPPPDTNPGLAHWTAQRDAWTLAITTNTSPPETLLPVPPPLLPRTHPVRRVVTPASYPTLYTKVVVKGLAPSVPINLADMTKALVEGWKLDGEWPPKSAVAEVPLAKKRGKDVGPEEAGRHGVSRGVAGVKKVLGWGGGHEHL